MKEGVPEEIRCKKHRKMLGSDQVQKLKMVVTY
jgi:hypothetical protein